MLPLPDDLPFAAHRLTPRELRADIARARLEPRGRLPDPQPDPPRARAPDQARPRVRGRARGAPARRRDEGRRRPGGGPLPGLRDAARGLLPEGADAPGRLSRRDALRRPARGALPRARPQELRDHAPDRGPRPRRRRDATTAPTRRSRSSTASFRPRSASRRCASSRRSTATPATRLASSRTCPHDETAPAGAVGHARARGAARAAAAFRVEFTRPEVAEVLRAHYAGGGTERRRPREAPALRRGRAAARGSVVDRGGFIVWFTGLSGAGKSTLAQALQARLAGRARRSRSSTATRCARTSRRASASARRTATRTSAGSATWPGCSPGTASRRHRRHLALPRDPRRGAPAGRGRTGSPSSRCSRARRARGPDRARREGALREGDRAARSNTSPGSPTPTSRRSSRTWSSRPTANRSRRAWRRIVAALEERGLVEAEAPPAIAATA